MLTVKFILEDDENDMIHVEHDGHEVWSETARDAWAQYFRHHMPTGVPVLLTTDAHDAPLPGDDRSYPDGKSTLARFARWLVDNHVNPDIREEDAPQVTESGSELWWLMCQVAERFYWYGADDVRERHGFQ